MSVYKSPKVLSRLKTRHTRLVRLASAHALSIDISHEVLGLNHDPSLCDACKKYGSEFQKLVSEYTVYQPQKEVTSC